MLAAAAPDRLVNVISAPGSGKTTIAAERYGYLRYQTSDLRGTLGLTFNRAAAVELRRRIDFRWGANCIKPPHRVITFDHLHVEFLTHLLNGGKITWPNGVTTLDVRDDYRGVKGFRFLQAGNYVRVAGLDNRRVVVSQSRKVTKPESGIGKVDHHRAVLNVGTVSHEDIRSILCAAMQVDELQQVAADWLSANYRAAIIDEVYDADDLDLRVAYLAAEAGLSVTLIGDPRQALYKWRGAKPEIVERLLEGTSDQFVAYEQPESFRFVGEQMPDLATNLRAGVGATLPRTDSSEVDVALARNWRQLWSVGDNILPLAFKTVDNTTDAAMNLLLDVVTRARLGTSSHGREGAIMKLRLDREQFQATQDEFFAPLIVKLCAGEDESQVLGDLRETIKSLGGHKPIRLPDKEATFRQQLSQLAARLNQTAVIPGLTVFQAKGREWQRVGVVLSEDQLAALESGLEVIEEEHCITYVAITRAKRFCGLLSTTPSSATAQLQLDM
ncbi:UvrD-helicase domain-containing protein [Actinomyces slackii]|uniref:UvrD-helicase domain-containing protein n=1 Tax=Actinomyces slackii TaxID=52774 RepID=UPI00146FC76E|nr:UvrD-helicase domain-containing protein [Actinomyces slackii]